MKKTATNLLSKALAYKLRGSVSLIEPMLVLAISAVIILTAWLCYLDIEADRFPLKSFVIFAGMSIVVASIVAWHKHKRIPLALARRIDPDVDLKIEDFLKEVRDAFLPIFIPDNFLTEELYIDIYFRYRRRYEVEWIHAYRQTKKAAIKLDNTGQNEFSESLNRLSLRTFGPTNHKLLRYWFSIHGIKIASEGLSMHQTIALHRKRIALKASYSEQEVSDVQ